MTTLTGKEVLEIDALLLENKMTLTAIGNRYNVSRATILAIKSGKNWSHLTHRKFERHLVGDLLGEIWIPIIGYEDSYQVSNYGRVKNVKFDNVTLKEPTINDGHPTLWLYKNNVRKTVRVKDIIATAFILIH
jgi:hypothetical protein